MKELFEKLKKLENEISSEKGQFVLFGIFLREDAPGKYDLLVSAPWMETDKKQSLEYLAKKISSKLNPNELLSLSRIVMLEKSNPALEAILKAVHVKQGAVEVKNSDFSGVQISHACISTSVSNVSESGTG
jgi:hypothetical protein